MQNAIYIYCPLHFFHFVRVLDFFWELYYISSLVGIISVFLKLLWLLSYFFCSLVIIFSCRGCWIEVFSEHPICYMLKSSGDWANHWERGYTGAKGFLEMLFFWGHCVRLILNLVGFCEGALCARRLTRQNERRNWQCPFTKVGSSSLGNLDVNYHLGWGCCMYYKKGFESPTGLTRDL